MRDGYCYEFTGSGGWMRASDEDWEITVYRPAGSERRVGLRQIDGSTCRVFKCGDDKLRAQVLV